MNFNAEQMTATSKANVEALKALSTQAYAGFEQLVELNLTATKALVTESFSHAQALLSAKDAQQVLALQSGLVQPLTEKSVAYGRHVYTIASDAGAEFSKQIEAKLAETQQVIAQLVDNVVKNAPAGTEPAVALFKTAFTSSQNAIETAQASAKKALELAESNVTAATNQAVKAVTSASKKKA
jgi:phasin family protein